MARLAVFVGTRPEIIKMASVLEALRPSSFDVSLIHTGQHYDWEMSGQFFKELGLAEPDEFLGVGSASQGMQLAKVVKATEKYLLKQGTIIATAEGDTNSALGAALAASKNNIPFAHVEAGCRSFDRAMPEELNRILISDCADLNLAPTKNCIGNLQREGIPDSRIKLTGHPIVTLLSKVRNRITSIQVVKEMKLKEHGYVLLTTHRAENVDGRRRLKATLKEANELPTKVVFPVHPRTGRNISRFHLKSLLSNIITTRPLSYFETLALIRSADAVITDSGGIQQEAFLLQTPCLTIRTTTEWVETVEAGVNSLVKDPRKIGAAYQKLHDERVEVKRRFQKAGPVFGGVESARRCAESIATLLSA